MQSSASESGQEEMIMVEPEMPEIEEAPFNMSMLFYMSLNKLLETKDLSYLGNDLGGWYKGLNRIYTKIYFKLNADERLKLDAWFKLTKELKMNGTDKEKIIETLHLIDLEISLCLDRYKMIFPKIEGKPGLAGVRKRYKI